MRDAVAAASTAALSSPVPAPVSCAIWGVLNVTPDSFSDGGQFIERDRALAHGRALASAGATVVDVGGESSRPAGKVYGEPSRVDEAEELRRVVPVVKALSAQGLTVSIDTVKARVAAECCARGAQIVNDVSCGGSSALLEAVAEAGAELVLMHNRGAGECAGDNVDYGGNVVDVVREELLRAAERAERLGVARRRVWIDPGIGFAKTAEQSGELIARIGRLLETGYRVLVGPSRKSFIAQLAPDPDGSVPSPQERLGGTAAVVSLCALWGVHAVRVHDVAMMRQAVVLAEQLRAGGGV